MAFTLAALVITCSAAGATMQGTWVAEEADFLARLNAERVAHGLAPLVTNPQITEVARSWTAQMAAEERLYHNPGLAGQVTGAWTQLGENVGHTSLSGALPGVLVERVHIALMNSPGHRANILGPYNQVGIGVVVTATGKLWTTQVFMQAPISPVAAPAPPPQPAATPAQPASMGQIQEAIAVSRELFADAGTGGRSARYAVLSRADVFADALAGAALAGDVAPMLFTTGATSANPQPALDPAVRTEIDRLLGGRGRVYLLGGAAAVSDVTARDLAAAGYDVARLAGPSRVETAVAVAREVLAVHGNNGEVLLARADTWPDAVTGGAYAAHAGTPLLLTGREVLHPAVADFLAASRPARRWALGGAAALTDQVVAAAGATRVAGADRTATATQIAAVLWGRTSGAPGDGYLALPSHHPAAWAYALAYAPYSAATTSPQLLVSDTVPNAVRSYLTGLGYSADRQARLRAASVVAPEASRQLEVLLGR